LAIAAIVSVVLAYVVAAMSWDDAYSPTPMQMVIGPLVLTPLYLGFVGMSGIVFGIPSLLIMRHLGWTKSSLWLVCMGGLVGAIAGLIVFGLIMEMVAVSLLTILAAMAGAIAAFLWWRFVEQFRLIES
jgi:hypothetical protein